MAANKRPLCAYCGLREGRTKDHVIPKCMFLPPLPNEMLTVPACSPCNESKGKDDDYLRDMLVINLENENHPVANCVAMKERVIRSIQKNRSHLIREGRRTRRATPFYSPGGLYLGTAPAISIDQERIDRTFGRIVRGLYFTLCNKRRLPGNTRFEVSMVHPMEKDTKVKVFDVPSVSTCSIGNSFACKYVVAKEDPNFSLWLLEFYYVLVVVSTNATHGATLKSGDQ